MFSSLNKQTIIKKVILSVIKFARYFFKGTWIERLSITNHLYRKFVHRLELSSIDYRGCRFLTKPGDITINPSLALGDYESKELDLIDQILKPGDTFLDVGANIGIYSVIASKGVGLTGKVWAVEPVPENLEILKRNLDENHSTNVQVIPCAAGSIEGRLPIFLSPTEIGTHSFGHKTKHSISVPIKTLDSIVGEEKINFIKMDIEGYEPEAFKGLTHLYQRQIPHLLIEINPTMLAESGFDAIKFLEDLFFIYKKGWLVQKKGLVDLNTARNAFAQITEQGMHANLYFAAQSEAAP